MPSIECSSGNTVYGQPGRRRTRFLPENILIAWVGSDQRHWPCIYILFRGLFRMHGHTEAAIAQLETASGQFLSLGMVTPHFSHEMH